MTGIYAMSKKPQPRLIERHDDLRWPNLAAAAASVASKACWRCRESGTVANGMLLCDCVHVALAAPADDDG